MTEYIPHDIYSIEVKDSIIKLEMGKNSAGRMGLEFSFCGPNALRVVSTRSKRVKRHTDVSITPKIYTSITVDQTDNLITLKSGMFQIDIHKNGNYQVDYYYLGQLITSQFTDSSFTYQPNDVFYGLGDENHSFILNGCDYNTGIAVNKSTTSQFIMCSNHFGIFINSIHPTDISVGTKVDNTIVFDSDSDKFEFVFFVGESYKSILKNYTDVISTNLVSPAKSFGTSVKFNDDFNIEADDIINYVDSLIQSGLNLSTVYLGYSYLPKSSRLGFTFDQERFNDPAGLCRKLHDRGIQVGLTVNPYISVLSDEFDECCENNTLVKDSNNDYIVFDIDNESFGILDFTHIAPRSYLQLKLDALIRLGVDVIECDFDFSYITDPSIDYKFRGNFDKSDVVNQFSRSMNEAYYEATSRVKGIVDSYIVSSHGTYTSNTIPVHNLSSYPLNIIGSTNSESYIRDMLNQALKCSMMGYDAINADIPSYASFINASISAGDNNTDSINESYTAMAINLAMLPHFRIITDNSNKDLAGIDSKVLNDFKTILNLKNSLLPYLFATAGDSNLYGTPTLRPLAMEFPMDGNCLGIDYEYMLGSNLLVVPSVPLSVANNSGFYIPEGKWTEMLTNTKIAGPGIVNYIPMGESYTKSQIFVKPNSVIPLRNLNNTTEGTLPNRGGIRRNLLNNITFMVYELQDGKVSGAEVYSEDMQTSGIINILRKGNKIKVLTKGFGDSKRIMLNGISTIVSSSEGIPQVTATGSFIEFNSDELMITLG